VNTEHPEARAGAAGDSDSDTQADSSRPAGPGPRQPGAQVAAAAHWQPEQPEAEAKAATSGISTPRITFGILGYVWISLGYPFFKKYPQDIPDFKLSHFCNSKIEISLTYLCCS
jgi:hypothetical protein